MSEKRWTLKVYRGTKAVHGGSSLTMRFEEVQLHCEGERVAHAVDEHWGKKLTASLNAAEESKRREGLLERIIAVMQERMQFAKDNDQLCPSCGASAFNGMGHWSNCFYANTLAEYKLTKGESDG